VELPKKLVSEFAKVTNDSETPKTETTVYGTIVKNGDSVYAKFDGSDLTTPVSTTTDIEDGDRVTVLVKDHTAVVTGNMTSPSARTDDVQAMDEKFDAEIGSLKVGKLSADEAKITYATIKNLEATDAKIEKLSAIDFDAKYANIDFANINMAAVEKLFTESGIIRNLVASDTQITGELVGVTIKGDLIEGNTVVADKLVIKGEDGLYYKLNTDGMTIEAQQTDYNSLNGSIITAKSITATKIAVDDLVAFDATIGGFNIGSNAIYSGAKAGINNTTRGIYLGKDGQLAIGDGNNYLKYYKDTDGSYKLALAFGSGDIQSAIDAAASDAADADAKATNALNTANVAASDAADAAKTATNFLSYDSTDGLQLGNKSGGLWSGYRTQITSSEFNILNSSGTEVASYGTNRIELGKDSTSSVIKLCGGEGSISYGTDSWGGSSFKINSASPTLSGTSTASLVCASSELKRSMIRVFPTQIYMYSAASDSVASSIDMNKNYIDITADSTITLKAPTVKDTYGEILSVDRGSSGTWEYKKWSNGDTELWGYYNYSGACSTALGNMYRTGGITTPSFPFTVTSPNVTASYESDGPGAILWPYTKATTSKPPNYHLVRPTSSTSISGKITFHVYGKWSA
jgi:hypothetical protein